ncbi:hypothetical protein GFK26_12560 [Variovorax paradoxus]|uniref:Uncharacterized protein n=1 Tax=Variovorax paradoxus TaxID=34073 RepID=A0A5Q0M1T5_VARPD|nr:hypothetical protein [Variovorax paradoxus]QFZ83531.1 hypothetical protein GFK26_12560 [Variovorax paradoxus]
MAQFIASASVAAQVSNAVESGSTLRSLKNRLQARFSTVRSSHLSEAIAAGLGFSTNAALRAALAGPQTWMLEHKKIDTMVFHRRLVELGYPLQSDFTLGPLAASPKPPAHFLDWLDQLRELEKAPSGRGGRISALRKQCANEFARTFELGYPEKEDDKRVFKRWSIGVDHTASLPGWGEKINCQRGGAVEFPGSDHRRRFYESLPLTNGKVVEYQRAMVSMPYVDAMDMPLSLEEASHLAGRIGWTCTVLSEWSWYAPGSTMLVLFKRSTPHSTMLQTWERSFKRWLLENRSTLSRSAGATRKMVMADIIDCQHLPLDLRDFEDCRERYLKEFAPHLYYGRNQGMTAVFNRLMESWTQQLLSSQEAAIK